MAGHDGDVPDVARPPRVNPASPVGVPDVTAYLLGTWTVDRELVDRAVRGAGTFRGTATFRPVPGRGDGEPPHVAHTERGELAWGGTAERTLRMRRGPDGTAHVTFPDGRSFHDLDLRAGPWTARHPCAADRYTGTFTVVSADEWHVRWDVVGPAKDQTLTTVYRRT